MAVIGYDHASQGIADHHIFGKGRARTHLAHFVLYRGNQWVRGLLFRDRLRADPALKHAMKS